MSGWKKPFSWHLRNDKRESGGQEAAVSHLPPDALFSAAVSALGGCHISRDGWFPGPTRTRRKNGATTMGRDPCWAPQSNSDVARGYFLFYWLQVQHSGASPTCCGTGERVISAHPLLRTRAVVKSVEGFIWWKGPARAPSK